MIDREETEPKMMGNNWEGPAVRGAHGQVPETTAPSRVREMGNLCFVPVTLLNPKSGTHTKIQALLDSGCSRDLISHMLFIGVGLSVVPLKRQLTFEQMERPLMGKYPCDHKTEKLHIGMGQHWETWLFIIAPTAKFP